MKIDTTKLLATIAKSSVLIVSRAAGFGFFGLCFNILVLVLLAPEMGIIADRMGTFKMDAASGPLAAIALVALVVAYWPITLTIIGFGLGFPLVYFLLGKKHGVAKAIQHIAKDNREFIQAYTIGSLVGYLKKRTGVADRVDATIGKSQLLAELPGFLKKLDTMPGPMRAIFRMLIDRARLGDLLTKMIEEQQGDGNAQINFDGIAGQAQEQLSVALEEKLLAPKLTWFAILLGANFALFILLKIVI